jgi:hypothetical protein
MDISQKKQHILDNTNELVLQDRKEILQMIFNSQFRNKLKEKGNGTQIRLKNLSDDLITRIYDFIVARLNDHSDEVLL